ncbi:hypothetical protein SEVIR_9G554600v4 [Setaria viridis]|uniref:DUF4005 domain-containing protein n=1 Tax=Setaria viridis TaxID=4556 RepID=A0A4V6D5Q1_SETVI|nr:uncharacterized protein LOC117835148 [Setaria viridis]TKV98345.1 hypothetical protein SEVIR_9G554600v2 [Setaria viridis]
MARRRGLCCLASPLRGKTSDADTRRRHSSAACICCIGPHHKPSGGSPDADLSVRLPLTSCCGSGGDVRGGGARTPRTPRTPCTPTARRLCGARSSRTPRRGQVCCFPAPHAAAAESAAASAGVPAAARTPRTPTTPIGRRQQGTCCVRVPAQGSAKLGRRRSWFRSARQAVAQTTPRLRGAGGRAAGSNSAVKVYDARLPEVEAEAAAATTTEEETCSNDEYALLCREGFSREDVAAVTIQAYFRGHLARRAFKALKSLVRLQAVARGAYVRRQAEVAINCMQAMVRLQMRVRARQMLTKPKDGQLLRAS